MPTGAVILVATNFVDAPLILGLLVADKLEMLHFTTEDLAV